MAINLADPFDFKAPWPIDLRMRRGDINGRNSIAVNDRWEGMITYVVSEQKWYGLVGGTGNENWVEIGQGAPGGVQNVTWLNNTTPTGGNDGDIAFNDTGSEVQLWYRQGGSWGQLGSWGHGGGVDAIQDDTLDFDTTSVAIENAHPDLSVGSIVYSETTGLMWTKLDEYKWTRSNLSLV